MANGVPNPLIRYVIALKDPKVLSLRFVNGPEKIKDLMLITYLFSTYLWYFSPDPVVGGWVDECVLGMCVCVCGGGLGGWNMGNDGIQLDFKGVASMKHCVCLGANTRKRVTLQFTLQACTYSFHIIFEWNALPNKFFSIIIFSTCGPNWTQVCSHIIGYIPVPIGLLFSIAPTHDWDGNGATQTYTWALRFIWLYLKGLGHLK